MFIESNRLDHQHHHHHLTKLVVIHTVGPRGEKPDLLRSAYNSVLQIVKEKKIRSVALCGISM